MPSINELKNKAMNFKRSLSQNGIEAEIRRIQNYLKYKKTVLDPYKEWRILNEPSDACQNAYKSPLNNKYTIVVQNDMMKERIKKQTYSNYEVKVLNIQDFEEVTNFDSDYVVFIGKDIRVLPFALYEVEKFLEYHTCNLIYADNDYYLNQERVRPDFKPHFAIDTLLSKNYFGNFIVVNNLFLKYNKGILKDLNEKEYVYNISLRVAAQTDKILHIDKILFDKEKDVLEQEEQVKIIEEYLKNKNFKYSSVEIGTFEGQYKINYLVEGNPKVSIVIPNMDHIDDLNTALHSILKSTYQNFEIVIVENNSKNEDTFKYYEKIKSQDSRIRIEKMEIKKFNYSAIVNYGVEKSTGEYIILLNNDVEVITLDWIEKMLMYTQRQDVGICGVKLYFPDKTIQHAGVTIGIRGLAGHRYREVPKAEFTKEDAISYVQDLSAVTAACFMVRKDLYDKVLGFDEKLAVAFNDVDFCLKVRKEGLLVVYNPFVELFHYESKSRGQDDTEEKQKRFAKEYETFVKRWQRYIQKGDPYFSKNYRLDTDIPTIDYNRRLDLF